MSRLGSIWLGAQASRLLFVPKGRSGGAQQGLPHRLRSRGSHICLRRLGSAECQGWLPNLRPRTYKGPRRGSQCNARVHAGRWRERPL